MSDRQHGSAKVYHDVDGNPVTLRQLIKLEPEWAHSRINVLEDREAEIDQLKAQVELLQNIAYCADGMLDCEHQANMGDAADWKRQLDLAVEKLYIADLKPHKPAQWLAEHDAQLLESVAEEWTTRLAQAAIWKPIDSLRFKAARIRNEAKESKND